MVLNGLNSILLAGILFDALALLAAVGSHPVDAHVSPKGLLGGTGIWFAKNGAALPRWLMDKMNRALGQKLSLIPWKTIKGLLGGVFREEARDRFADEWFALATDADSRKQPTGSASGMGD